jgi:predicted  nucleic acid-binding Zn-ribbon protein
MSSAVTLPALLALFKIDRDLQRLRNGLEVAQKEQKAQQNRIAQLAREAESQHAEQMRLQADIGVCELDLKSRQEHIEKMRDSLNTTKTNKEYSAILVHISAEKAEVAKMETALLEQMQQLENLGKSIGGLREQIQGEEQVLAKIEAQHADKVGALTSQVAELSERREAAARDVPPDALRQYERVSQKYPGDAMAEVQVDEEDLESLSCGSCYMGLNIEHLNALRGRDAIRRCDCCSRILYLPDMLAAIGK